MAFLSPRRSRKQSDSDEPDDKPPGFWHWFFRSSEIDLSDGLVLRGAPALIMTFVVIACMLAGVRLLR